ncbi:MAG TPA: glycosyltransferase [Polyangiaceae bacterium]|nr:glycosyltransferase [Polyangiaceae bacterium]
MKVVHLTTSAGRAGGGAYASAYRIHASLRELGVASEMLCSIRRVDDPSVTELPRKGAAGWRRRLAIRLDGTPLRLFRPKPHMPFNNGFVGALAAARHPLVQSADVLQLYWVAAGFLSVRSLGSLLGLGKPVVWRLSDMWAFTGGCHYPLECQRYREHCGHCPELERPFAYDISRLNFELKRAAYGAGAFTIVTPSRFLASACRQSALLGHARIEQIPTGIDVNAFCPRDRVRARARLGLPASGRVVLFGARGGLSDPRKGGRFAVEAAQYIAKTERGGAAPPVCFAVFGRKELVLEGVTSSVNLGLLDDEQSLADAYSAADVFLAPSLQDNLPNTVLEAIACGCPVVGFRDAGLDDAIRDGQSGFLVPRGDAVALGEACRRVLEDADLAAHLRESARLLAEHEFDQDLQAQRFLSLYRELLDQRSLKPA